MIRNGRKEDQKAIFDLYSKSALVSLDNHDDYFGENFIGENVVVNEINGHVAASLQVNYYPLCLNGRLLSCAYIFGMFYDKNKNDKPLVELLDEVVKQQQYKTLVTIVPAYKDVDFDSYGFEDIYEKRIYTIDSKDLPNASYQGVSIDFTIDELDRLYKDFTANFNGYFKRSRSYWLSLLKLLQFKRYNIAIYHNQQGKAEGYMIYYYQTNKTIIKEIIYSNGTSLTRLLCYGLRNKKSIQVYTSANEDFSKAYPSVKCKTVVAFKAKINDMELFNKLYGTRIRKTKRGFYLEDLPLYISQEIY